MEKINPGVKVTIVVQNFQTGQSPSHFDAREDGNSGYDLATWRDVRMTAVPFGHNWQGCVGTWHEQFVA